MEQEPKSSQDASPEHAAAASPPGACQRQAGAVQVLPGPRLRDHGLWMLRGAVGLPQQGRGHGALQQSHQGPVCAACWSPGHRIHTISPDFLLLQSFRRAALWLDITWIPPAWCLSWVFRESPCVHFAMYKLDWQPRVVLFNHDAGTLLLLAPRLPSMVRACLNASHNQGGEAPPPQMDTIPKLDLAVAARTYTPCCLACFRRCGVRQGGCWWEKACCGKGKGV